MNFKLDFNNDIHVLSQKPSSLSDLKKQIKQLYDDLKKVDFFQIKYKDKEGFMITIQSEQDLAQALQAANEIKNSSLKFYILAEIPSSQFSLMNQERSNFVLKTPSTTSELMPSSKPKFFLFDNSNTTSSDEKFTGGLSEYEREKLSGIVQDINKNNNNFKFEEPLEPLGFIRVEEEKILKESVEGEAKKSLKSSEEAKKNKKKAEFISSENVFNKLEKFQKVRCYKCKGTGLNNQKKNKKCKKCKGTGDFANSSKSSVIDFFIKEKLGNIYREFEQKLSQSDQTKSRFFASENATNTFNASTNSSFGICTICGINIEGSHKFKCSKCPLLTLCEKCEDSLEHPHPLMKIKRNQEESKFNFSKSVQLNYPFSSTDSSQLSKSINKKPLASIESSETQQNKLMSSISSPYKAKFLDEHFTEKVSLGAEFALTFHIQNNGENKWPENMEFICISGYFQSTAVAVASLDVLDTYAVNVRLLAPKKEETLNSSWRLGYMNKNDKKFFGPKINSTVWAMKPEKLALKESSKDKEIKKKFISH